MDDTKFEELLLDPDNPRDIGPQQFKDLKAALHEFGDLGGFVRNITTGQLVGAHQRKRSFDEAGGDKRVVITHRFEQASRTGTRAVGYIEHDGEWFAYREVEWTKEKQHAANVAANRIGGTFNLDKLAKVNYELLQADENLLKLTGQTPKEVKSLLSSVGVGEPEDAPADAPIVIKVSGQDAAVMDQLTEELKQRGLRVKRV